MISDAQAAESYRRSEVLLIQIREYPIGGITSAGVFAS